MSVRMRVRMKQLFKTKRAALTAMRNRKERGIYNHDRVYVESIMVGRGGFGGITAYRIVRVKKRRLYAERIARRIRGGGKNTMLGTRGNTGTVSDTRGDRDGKTTTQRRTFGECHD